MFYDFLIEEGIRKNNPVGHSNSSQHTAGLTRARVLFRRHRKLPWIPSEEQWQAILSVARREPLRNHVMLALSYDAALRRQELPGLETVDIDDYFDQRPHRMACARCGFYRPNEERCTDRRK